ncbi:MAG: hypothetical protein RLZZ458_269 [Planctomycetota bacterium]|jgi:hypothetical protein
MSDDQIAILGSFAALAFCGVLMALSYHFGGTAKSDSSGTGFEKETARPIRGQQSATSRRAA